MKLKENDLSKRLEQAMEQNKSVLTDVSSETGISASTVSNVIAKKYLTLRGRTYAKLLNWIEAHYVDVTEQIQQENGDITISEDNLQDEYIRINGDKVLEMIGIKEGDYIQIKDEDTLYKIERDNCIGLSSLVAKEVGNPKVWFEWYEFLAYPIKICKATLRGDKLISQFDEKLGLIGNLFIALFGFLEGKANLTYKEAWNMIIEHYPNYNYLDKTIREKLEELSL